MNLFEPPPREPTRFTPGGVLRRIGFDLVLGVSLGVGAACASFAASWATFGGADVETRSTLVWFVLAIGLGDALLAGGLAELVRRWPKARVLLTVHSALRSVAFALLVGWAALILGRRLSQAVDRDFATLVGLSVVLGVTWLVSLRAAWREARARATPWIVAAVSLYLAADWSVKLGPSVDRFDDPRVNIAYFAIIGCGAYAVCAVLAVMDWMISWRNRDAEATKNG
jgi:hypothetical protein